MSSNPAPRATKKKSRKGSLPPPTPSEAAFERALAALCHPEQPASAGVVEGRADSPRPDDIDTFVERAFAKAGDYAGDRYSTIGDAVQFFSKIAGVSFEGRQDVIAGLRPDAELDLRREPANVHDANAIAVYYGGLQLGYVKKGIAAHVAPLIDAGARYRARVASLTGGRAGNGDKHRGVNILVTRDSQETIATRDRGRAALRTRWEGDATRVRAALIGDALPHEAQEAVLERLERGQNTLAVMGTGRGKSFCFQFAAALRALGANAKTLVLYPLRALGNDQYEALMRTLDPLGLRIYRANGSISNDERTDLFEALRDGAWDIVLATPEFLEFHRGAFAESSKPSLLVVDEAHHVYDSRHRPAYAHLRATIAGLGNPQLLALTATAGDERFRKIVDELAIDAWVIDPTVRDNLRVVDVRGRKDKARYLVDLFGGGEKGIVYTNSRNGASDVAAQLRKHFGNEVMFYHAGMPSADRRDVERFFREGALRVVVATSAFGEGIDLPDVRHVVLYHLNFDFGEFNQQAGRAGRDGAAAEIHLLYGEKDRSINEYLIDLDSPTLPTLREIYRGLRKLARSGLLRSGNGDLARLLDLERVEDQTVGAALRIFADSGLVEIGEDDDGRYVRFLPVAGRIDMERNERYAEGTAIRDNFAQFSAMALTARASDLERVINRPIYPGRVALRR
jgi:single-stranded-DNA-specific exonuclease